MMEKGNYRHFMEKEIHDQPEGCQRTISAYVDAMTARAAMPGDLDFKAALERIQIVACGTSYIAGVIGKYLIEQLADLPVDVEIASEFRYRQPALRPGSLVIAMSQSGETADTLAALRYCKAKGMKSAVVVNATGIDHGPRGRRGPGRSTADRRSASPRPRPSPPRSA
jgi:glucosamine--fructose-6-phosphate aminotransferase (isomerizing)